MYDLENRPDYLIRIQHRLVLLLLISHHHYSTSLENRLVCCIMIFPSRQLHVHI